MKKIFLFLFVLMPVFLFAQKKAMAVLQAEKTFAAYSVQHGTKAAFLQFADSSGVVFEGSKAVNAIETWSKREARPGVLNWHPVYGFLAASGEMGFTTGPWTFQPKTITDSVVARGQYSTVWHKTTTGEWKFLVDIGVSNTPVFDSATFQLGDADINFIPGTPENLLEAEKAFIQTTQQTEERLKSYLAAASQNAFLFNRDGHLPTTTLRDIRSLIATMPTAIGYRITGSGISQSGDLGYVYGNTTINSRENSYLRIWRREGSAWKLALEVLPY